jgi:hypothetical protein
MGAVPRIGAAGEEQAHRRGVAVAHRLQQRIIDRLT